MDSKLLDRAKDHLAALIEEQFARIERMKIEDEWIDYSQITPVIGICGGDGIGPYISQHAPDGAGVLTGAGGGQRKGHLPKYRGAYHRESGRAQYGYPDDVLDQLKQCHVILKGPTTTPRRGDPWPNIESANVAMRRELDLFANVRPVHVPSEGIDWTFFRENTEGAYILGSKGIHVNDDLALDFTVTTTQGSDRIIRLAFEDAQRNGINQLTVVTKANVIKTTDGKFLDIAREIAEEYPEVAWDDWYIDIMTAKLVDPKRRRDFKVVILPNLYGDILTDEAAEFQGGVGTAGSANIGRRYAMFEAIHGSAPRMVQEGRADYANPSSIIRAGAMLLNHIGFTGPRPQAGNGPRPLRHIRKQAGSHRPAHGATGAAFADYLMETIQQQGLEERWQGYQVEASVG